MDYDVFISHASEDKAYARSLAQALEAAGLHVWFDEMRISWGDSLRASIDDGLSKSRYGILILSKSLLSRKWWTEYEIDALFSLERKGRRTILPIWHDITEDDVRAYSPALSMRLAKRSSTDSVAQIVDAFCAFIGEEVRSFSADDTSNKIFEVAGIDLSLAEVTWLLSLDVQWGDHGDYGKSLYAALIDLADLGLIAFTADGIDILGGGSCPVGHTADVYDWIVRTCSSKSPKHMPFTRLRSSDGNPLSVTDRLVVNNVVARKQHFLTMDTFSLVTPEVVRHCRSGILSEMMAGHRKSRKVRALLSIMGNDLPKYLAVTNSEETALSLKLAILKTRKEQPSVYDDIVEKLSYREPTSSGV